MAIPEGWSSVATGGVDSPSDTRPYWQELGSEELTITSWRWPWHRISILKPPCIASSRPAPRNSRGTPALYPSIDASAGTTRNYQDLKNTTAARGLGSISYEVDLWGKNRNQLAAANYRADATQYDREALQLIVAADAATFYTQ